MIETGVAISHDYTVGNCLAGLHFWGRPCSDHKSYEQMISMILLVLQYTTSSCHSFCQLGTCRTCRKKFDEVGSVRASGINALCVHNRDGLVALPPVFTKRKKMSIPEISD